MSYEIRNNKLMREAYEAGYRDALNEQSPPGGGMQSGGCPPGTLSTSGGCLPIIDRNSGGWFLVGPDGNGQYWVFGPGGIAWGSKSLKEAREYWNRETGSGMGGARSNKSGRGSRSISNVKPPKGGFRPNMGGGMGGPPTP